MLTKQNILSRLKKNKSSIEKFGISQLGLFGSYVRNEQKANSDIDIYIDFYKQHETYDNFIELCFFLDDLFKHSKVDVVSKNGLSPFIGSEILKTIEYV